MTYRYYKTKGWVGFCDECEQPFKPIIVNATIRVIDNHAKRHFHMDLSKHSMRGWCDGCRDCFEVRNISTRTGKKMLIVREVDGVVVV